MTHPHVIGVWHTLRDVGPARLKTPLCDGTVPPVFHSNVDEFVPHNQHVDL